MILESDVPKVTSMSDEFNDLLKKLLEKDPTVRINWREIKQHPFWITNSPVYEFDNSAVYPPQP